MLFADSPLQPKPAVNSHVFNIITFSTHGSSVYEQAYVGGEVTASGRTAVPLPEAQEEVFDLSALEALASGGDHPQKFQRMRSWCWTHDCRGVGTGR